MIASLPAFGSDCSVHWFGPLSMLVIGLGFCGVQLGSGSLVAHIDLASRHAGVISGLTGAVGSIAYFVVPSLIRLCAVKPDDLASTSARHQSPIAPPLVPVCRCMTSHCAVVRGLFSARTHRRSIVCCAAFRGLTKCARVLNIHSIGTWQPSNRISRTQIVFAQLSHLSEKGMKIKG